MVHTERQSPEEIELAARLQDLRSLEDTLVQAELELATAEVELREFQHLYLRQVGPVLAELDAIEAQVAELRARQKPSNVELRSAASAAANRAQHSAEAVSAIQADTSLPKKRTEDLRKIYREAARKLHPDLAENDQQREARHEFMSRVNRAYEAGDPEEIKRILDEWEFAPEAVPETDTGSRLVRTIRSIARVRRRLEEIATSIKSLRASDAWVLKESWEAARAEGRDLLAQIAETAASRITDLRQVLQREQSGSKA